MCSSQGIPWHLFGKRTQSSSSWVNLAFYFLGFHYNAQPQNILKYQTTSFWHFQNEAFQHCVENICQFCFYSDYLSSSFDHSEPFLSNKCYPDFSPLLSFAFQMALLQPYWYLVKFLLCFISNGNFKYKVSCNLQCNSLLSQHQPCECLGDPMVFRRKQDM